MVPAPSRPDRERGEGDHVEVGRVIGAFGIKGWIRLRSHTAPPEAILRYERWQLAGREWRVLEGQGHGGAVIASLEGLEDRDAAAALRDAPIAVPRAALPAAKQGEFYWADVLGSEVVSTSGATLGRLVSLTSNGAQDVMVVVGERERLIPAVWGAIVKAIDSAGKRIVVDWEPEY